MRGIKKSSEFQKVHNIRLRYINIKKYKNAGASVPISGRDLQKRAFRDHSELSLLTEVLSWRRTLGPAGRLVVKVTPSQLRPAAAHSSWAQLLLMLLLLVLVPGAGSSESPERECCENPAYNFQDGGGVVTTAGPPPPPAHHQHAYSPPEEPDMLPEVPELPGLLKCL